MKKIVFVFVFVFVLFSATARAESAFCVGSYWQYEYLPGIFSCDVKNTVHTDIPGVYQKGYVSKTTISNEECWKSVAKIQMGGAKCCIVTDNKLEPSRCINK